MFQKHLPLAIVGLLACGASADAALIASDSFESYTPGSSVVGQNGGSATGWTSAWVSNAASGSTREVTTATLSAGGESGGNQAVLLENIENGGNAGYAISRSFTRTTGTTYASFLVRAENLGGNEFINFYFSDGLISSGDANEMAGGGLKNAAGNPFFARYGSSASGTTVTTAINASTTPASDFLVVLKVSKADMVQFYDTADLWVFDANTSMPATESTPTAHAYHSVRSNMNGTSQFSVRVLNLAEGESLLVDNVRIGTTWDAVAVPEPASLFLLAPAVLLLRPRHRTT